ncbi:hypothetical protein SUDANB95_02194 [Actinosynnema sp. ALI-1.44]
MRRSPLQMRRDGLALADPDGPVDFRVHSAVFGVNSLEVTW